MQVRNDRRDHTVENVVLERQVVIGRVAYGEVAKLHPEPTEDAMTDKREPKASARRGPPLNTLGGSLRKAQGLAE